MDAWLQVGGLGRMLTKGLGKNAVNTAAYVQALIRGW
jgi:hypothetical protein